MWFAENLRYVQEGKTISNDLTELDNGVWYPINIVDKSFATDQGFGGLTNNYGTLKNVQYISLMPAKTKGGSCNGALG